MKRILISGCMFVFMLAATQVMSQEKIKEKEDKTKVKDDNSKEKTKDGKTKIKDDNTKIKIKGQDANMMYPYKAGYSSNFTMGNPAHAKLVLDVWKDWDDNMLDRHDFMADTIVWYLPDGSVTKGKEANLAGAKKFRGGLTSSVSTIDAWMPLRSVDMKEDWVAVWGTETDTWPDGKVDKREIHEIWRINKDGKVDWVRQYSSAAARQ
ncbi:MAG: hypothetical protein JWO92_1842 [Chitinophagaceae bacterium]|nr:hypothetical protein [Chitinophagaceae bacterium]MDB5223971.1 hypothetical protein [Chitinophagaceae bacterium]